MFARWVAATSEYNAAHGTAIVAVASLGGKVKGESLNLEDPAVRAKMVAGVKTMLELGAGGVSLDLEPYPTSPGLLALLEEIRALFAERGYAGKLGEAAPANIARWSPSYVEQVTALFDQVNPLFYDSERKTASAYEQWVREGLAYYSANAAPGTRIVPDLPSYGTNRWHDPAAENLTTATTAVEEALAQGSRVNGAGIYWWWGFYYDEEGEGSYDGAADREAWLEQHAARSLHALSSGCSAPSSSSSQRLRSSPPPYPPSAPPVRSTRWHGITIGIGFDPSALPAAREPRGLPASPATWA